MASATRSQVQLIEECRGISFRGRTIFKVGGSYFYVSTGECSKLPGMVFPIYGIDKTGWLIKPQGTRICWGLCSAKLRTVDKKIRDLCPGAGIERRNFMARFSTLEQMYASYKFGHLVWEGPIGKAMEVDFGFDPKQYKSLVVPSRASPVDDVSSANKWLKTA